MSRDIINAFYPLTELRIFKLAYGWKIIHTPWEMHAQSIFQLGTYKTAKTHPKPLPQPKPVHFKQVRTPYLLPASLGDQSEEHNSSRH